MNGTELFVVRVWRQLATGFRASVRCVDRDETHHFSRPEEIARFLSSPADADATAIEPGAEPPRTNP